MVSIQTEIWIKQVERSNVVCFPKLLCTVLVIFKS
jgi:hypothetical protein